MMIPKDSEFRNLHLLNLARDQCCQNCGSTRGVVSAHANWSDFGKGKSHKAHDCFVAWLCDRCHSWLDQGIGSDPSGLYIGVREGKREMWQRAANKTLLEMWRQGRLAVK